MNRFAKKGNELRYQQKMIHLNNIKDEIIDTYYKVKHLDKVALIFHTSTKYIKEILYALNIQTKTRRNNNPMPFKLLDMDNPISTYWLGLLYADGYLLLTKIRGTLVIKLQSKDHNLLCNLAEYIGISLPKICTRVRPDLKCGQTIQSVIQLGHRRFVVELDKIWRKEIPKLENCIASFIRGIFDGDGHIRIPTPKSRGYRVTIAFGNKDLTILKAISSYLHKIRIHHVIRDHNKYNHAVSYITIERKAEVIKFINLIYSVPGPSMKRKHLRAKKIIERCSATNSSNVIVKTG